MKTTLVNCTCRSLLALLSLIAVPTYGYAAEKTGSSDAMPIQVSPYTARPPVTAQNIAQGKTLYDRSCVLCHGNNGKGKGPVAYFLSRDTGPHPRNFTDGIYKFRSTPSGELPMDEDLFRTITYGISGFMPGFAGLSSSDRWKVIYYIKTFYKDFENASPKPLKIDGGPIPMTSASVRRGYEVYQQFKCWECHGGGGEGNGHKAPNLKDDWGFPLPPADLTRPNAFKNGNRPEDIFLTIMTGLDGGAMASYADSFAGRESDAWHLVNYIRALSERGR